MMLFSLLCLIGNLGLLFGKQNLDGRHRGVGDNRKKRTNKGLWEGSAWEPHGGGKELHIILWPL